MCEYQVNIKLPDDSHYKTGLYLELFSKKLEKYGMNRTYLNEYWHIA